MRYACYLNDYQQYLQKEELAESTIRIYLRHAERLLEALGGDKPTKERMILYKETLAGQGLSVATQNLHIIAVNRYLDYISKSECRIKTYRIQRRQSLEAVLSMKEYKRMLSYTQSVSEHKYFCILKTLASTGIRVSELKFFTVDALKRNRIEISNKGKCREIYLPEQLKNELKEYCSLFQIETGCIFRGTGENCISRMAVYNMIRKIAVQTDVPIEKAHPHSFRHLFAKTYMERYGNLAELADLLGHSSLETTRIYTVSTREEKIRKIGELGF